MKIQDLKHYVTPHLKHDKPDIPVIHIGSNNVSYGNLDIDSSILAERRNALITVQKKW